MSNVKFKITDHILLITIDREEALNAINDGMIKEIGKIMESHKDDDQVYGVIITGAGHKAFVAGADIKDFPGYDIAKGTQLSRSGHQVFNAIENYPKPVIAAVNGYALGGGLELAMACHMRIATENAVLGMPETKLGLIPGYGGTQRLAYLIGRAKAMEYILTADMIDATTAVHLGLVNHIVISDLLLEKCREIIGKIAKRGPLAVSLGIEAINASVNPDLDGFEVEIKHFGTLMASAQAKEGVAAFLEKRKPDFRK